jgi:hypothetical protein
MQMVSFYQPHKNYHSPFCRCSEDNLQSVFTLQNIAENCGMEISLEKSEVMAFVGQDPVRCKNWCG